MLISAHQSPRPVLVIGMEDEIVPDIDQDSKTPLECILGMRLDEIFIMAMVDEILVEGPAALKIHSHRLERERT